MREEESRAQMRMIAVESDARIDTAEPLGLEIGVGERQHIPQTECPIQLIQPWRSK